MNYKIVADSSSNVFALDNISYSFVPLKIITSQSEYIDSPELDLAAMVDEIKVTKGRSGTSCPNVHDWLQAFEGADRVFAITITSNLSGSCAAAKQAAEEYEATHEGARVFVVDSLSAGPELRLIAEKLREMINDGCEFDSIVKNITKYQKHTHLLFSLQSLTNLARNGRVNPAVAKIAGVLGIRIVGAASAVGTLEPMHKCRGEKKALEAVYKVMLEKGFSGGNVRIAHCFNPESARQLTRMIRADHPDCCVSIEPCTALCSFYAEKGGLMIGFEDAGA